MPEGDLGPHLHLDTEYLPGPLFHFERCFRLEDMLARQHDDLAAHSLRLSPYEDDLSAFASDSTRRTNCLPQHTQPKPPRPCEDPRLAKRVRTSVLLDCPHTPPPFSASPPNPRASPALPSPLLGPAVPTGHKSTLSPFSLGSLSPLTPLSSPSPAVSPLLLGLPALPSCESAPSTPSLAGLSPLSSPSPRTSPLLASGSPDLSDVCPLSPLLISCSDSGPTPPPLSGADAPGADSGPRRPPKRPRSSEPQEETEASPCAKRAPNKRGFSTQGRGAKGRRARRGSRFQDAKGDPKMARALGLRQRVLRAANVAQPHFSMERDASVSKSGWMGRPVKKAMRVELCAAIEDGTIWDMMSDFALLHHVEGETSLGVDWDGRIFVYQTQCMPWVGDVFEDIYTRADQLISSSLDMDAQQKRDLKEVRGPHFALVLGHYRQYSDCPTLTGFHSKNFEAAEAFRLAPSVQRLTGVVESVTRAGFPKAAARFSKSVEWHKDVAGKGLSKNKRKAARAQIEPLFGLYWNFCLNFAHSDQDRVHCLPHADTKNIVGVCVIVVYQKPGHRFNHKKRSWLVLWEAKLIVEMPPWTITAYPSSLLLHFNIDLQDFRFVNTDGELPTKDNSEEFGPDDSTGRGSIVYFNEASMYQSSETGFATLRQAKQAGVDTDRDYGDDLAKAFSEYRTCHRMM